MRPLICAVAIVTGCSNQPSKLDQLAKPPNDPWAAKPSSAKSNDEDKDKGGLGFDLPGLFAQLKAAIDKPGPYEAAAHAADYDAQKPHWGVMKLAGKLVEREAFSLTGGSGTELTKIRARLAELAKDPLLTGVLLRLDGLEVSVPDAVELRAAMHAFRAAGKGLACHVESAANTTYLVLAACDRIGLAPLGDIAITGPTAMPIHVKPLLDKLGVTADFLHVGAYKGAAEPLTRDAPSKEMEETLAAILDRRYQTMTDVIASDRKVDAKALVDTGLFTADAAKSAHLVDEVAPFEAFRDEVVKGAWTHLALDGKDDSQVDTIMKLARFAGAAPPDRPIGPHVALVYALGNIVDGNGEGVLGAREEIASHTLVAALHALALDSAVTAVVLRIDSGGGSAQASELIWRAVAELVAKKPVIVSMSDVAASGGYYIASGATKIFALDDTLTGSIGVVGGKIAPGAALAKLGVTTFPRGRGKHATMMTSLDPWSEGDKAIIQASMDAVYKVFVSRVAEGRHMTPEKVDAIAQGRVWTGTKAKELGLVDEIGGLDAALAEARRAGNVDAKADLEVYPPSATLRDVLARFGKTTGVALGPLEELRAADPQLAAAAASLVQLALSFQQAQIQTVAALPVLR